MCVLKLVSKVLVVLTVAFPILFIFPDSFICVCAGMHERIQFNCDDRALFCIPTPEYMFCSVVGCPGTH